VQGYGASSLWKQRAHRWTVSALRITGSSPPLPSSPDSLSLPSILLSLFRSAGKSLYSFFTYDTKGGLLSNIAFRLYRLREYKIIFVQVMYIPFCIIILSRGFISEFIVVKLLLFLWPFLRNLFINYICWRGQPELQVPFETVFLSPFFNYFLILCAIHGRLKCLLWYIPNVPPNHGTLSLLLPRLLFPVPPLLLSSSLSFPIPPSLSSQECSRDANQETSRSLRRRASGFIRSLSAQ
jgi:hypothetical protein